MSSVIPAPRPFRVPPRVIQGSFIGGRPQILTSLGPADRASLKSQGPAIKLPDTMLMPGGAGRRLPEALQRKMETFFRADFSDVRVHVARQAAALGAFALTQGNDIYFAPGQYNPALLQGERMLGHELAHVLQQRAGRVRNPFGSGVAIVHDLGLEAEAERLSLRVTAAPPYAHSASTSPLRPSIDQYTRSQPGLQRKVSPTARFGRRPVLQKHARSAPAPVLQCYPADPKGVKKLGDDVQYSLERNQVFALESLPKEVQLYPHPKLRIDDYLWQLYDSQDRKVMGADGDSFPLKELMAYHQQGYGTYVLRCFAYSGNQLVGYEDFVFTVLGPRSTAETVRNHPLTESKYWGSHWTSTAFDSLFTNLGLREIGNDARFGEGLYTTTDDETGLMAGFSMVQKYGGEIREWKVYSMPGTEVKMVSSKEISGQWTPQPWRLHPQLGTYIKNYTGIVNPDESEIKFNPHSYGSVIYIVPGKIVNVKANQLLLQQIIAKRLSK